MLGGTTTSGAWLLEEQQVDRINSFGAVVVVFVRQRVYSFIRTLSMISRDDTLTCLCAEERRSICIILSLTC